VFVLISNFHHLKILLKTKKIQTKKNKAKERLELASVRQSLDR